MATTAAPTLTPPLTTCAGPCGRTMRPKRTTREQYPGTVRLESHGMCQRCKAAAYPSTGAHTLPRRGVCTGCRRTTRPRDTTIEQYPGTVVEYSVDKCRTCARHERKGPPQYQVTAPEKWADCDTCHRPMRPRQVRAKDAPGTVRYQEPGKCLTCHNREQHPEKVDRPLVIGRTVTRPLVRHVAPPPPRQAAPEPKPARPRTKRPKELTPLDEVRKLDPNLATFYAARRARAAAEEARRNRVGHPYRPHPSRLTLTPQGAPRHAHA